MSDRRYEGALDALSAMFQEVRESNPEGIEQAFVARLLSIQMRHHAYAVLRPLLEKKIGEGGHLRGAPTTDGQPSAATSPSPSDGIGHPDTDAASVHNEIVIPSDSHAKTPDEGGQHGFVAKRDLGSSAPSSGSPRDGEGHELLVASSDPKRAASPSRSTPKGMDPAFRKALLAEKTATARTILFALHDGRDIMKVRMRELPAYRALGARQAAICNRILNHARNAGPDQNVSDVITETTLRRFVAEAERGLRHVGV